MRIIAQTFFLVVTALISFNLWCSVQVAQSDLDLYTKTAFELYALDHKLSLESHLHHITNLIFGRSEPGYMLFTNKLMRNVCKKALRLADTPIMFYNQVIHEFDKYVTQSASSRKWRTFLPTRQMADTDNRMYKEKIATITNTCLMATIIGTVSLLYYSNTCLLKETDNLKKELANTREEMSLRHEELSREQKKHTLKAEVDHLVKGASSKVRRFFPSLFTQ